MGKIIRAICRIIGPREEGVSLAIGETQKAMAAIMEKNEIGLLAEYFKRWHSHQIFPLKK